MAAVLERDCCSICLGDYKDPRILPCQHVFCCQCLLDYVAEKKQINCPNCMREVEIPPEGVEALLKVVDEPPQESTEPEDCDVCKKGNQAAFQCFECDKSMCVACKKFHDVFSSNHPIHELKTSDLESFCESHPKSFLKFYCKSCKSPFCQVCLDEDHHSKHFVLGIEDYFTEKKELFEDYQQKIDGKLKNISKVITDYISRETGDLDKIKSRIPKLEADLKSYKEIARHREKIYSEEDGKLSKKLTAAIKHLDQALNKPENVPELLGLIVNLESNIEKQQLHVQHTSIGRINDEMGTLDVKIGRLFSFRFQDSSIKSKVFFVGGIHWTVEVSIDNSDDNKLDTKITLKSFEKEEDKQLVESVSADLLFTVTFGDDSVVKKESKIFSSRTDSIKNDNRGISLYSFQNHETLTCHFLTVYKTKLKPKYRNDQNPSHLNNLKICFDITEIKYKAY